MNRYARWFSYVFVAHVKLLTSWDSEARWLLQAIFDWCRCCWQLPWHWIPEPTENVCFFIRGGILWSPTGASVLNVWQKMKITVVVFGTPRKSKDDCQRESLFSCKRTMTRTQMKHCLDRETQRFNRGHYVTNPNNALFFSGNPLELYAKNICIVWFPPKKMRV